jgi:hypothetical protein
MSSYFQNVDGLSSGAETMADGMTRADGFTVKLISPPTNETKLTSRLFHHGRDTGQDLPGAILEASLKANNEWLLFLTHDIPFEESLEICLLGSNFEVLDRATLMAPNATGSFENLRILSEQRVRFRFLGKGFWELELLKKPGFRLRLMGEPLGAVRPFGFSRRFTLSCIREGLNALGVAPG